jgi:hypothetical protein
MYTYELDLFGEILLIKIDSEYFWMLNYFQITLLRLTHGICRYRDGENLPSANITNEESHIEEHDENQSKMKE